MALGSARSQGWHLRERLDIDDDWLTSYAPETSQSDKVGGYVTSLYQPLQEKISLVLDSPRHAL